MERWEHRTVLIQRVEGEWLVDYGGGDTLTGIDRILDEYGGKGWELVSFVPHAWKTSAGQFGPFEASAYRAVFKRPVAAPPAGDAATAAALAGSPDPAA